MEFYPKQMFTQNILPMPPTNILPMPPTNILPMPPTNFLKRYLDNSCLSDSAREHFLCWMRLTTATLQDSIFLVSKNLNFQEITNNKNRLNVLKTETWKLNVFLIQIVKKSKWFYTSESCPRYIYCACTVYGYIYSAEYMEHKYCDSLTCLAHKNALCINLKFSRSV